MTERNFPLEINWRGETSTDTYKCEICPICNCIIHEGEEHNCPTEKEVL